MQEWFDAEAETASFAQIVDKQAEVEAKVHELFSGMVSEELAQQEEWEELERIEVEANVKGKIEEDREKQMQGMVTDVRQLSFCKRMKMVMEEKESGTEWFKRENWEKASMHWTRAVNHCAFFVAEDMVEEEAAEILKIKTMTFLNLQLCMLKARMWNHVLEMGEKVLAHRDVKSEFWSLTNTDLAKCLYRRGVALCEIKQWDAAEEELREARELQPGDANIRNQLNRVAQGRKSESGEERRSYGRMWNSKTKSANALQERTRPEQLSPEDAREAAQAKVADEKMMMELTQNTSQ